MELGLVGKVIIRGRIRAVTGIHIGGAQGSLDIGGIDNGVVKDAEGKPYIPGSSLKGKMRALLEQHEGYLRDDSLVVTVTGSDPIRMHMCDDEDCPVCTVFGRTNGKKFLPNGEHIQIKAATPTRLQVRDAHLIDESIESIRDTLALEYTEVKWENSIDRVTSAANPRQMERVPRGAEFDMEIVYNVLCEHDRELFSKVLTAMKLLEDDFIGGSGSRGYGKIEFDDLELFWRSRDDYETGDFSKSPIAQGTLADIMSHNIAELLV